MTATTSEDTVLSLATELAVDPQYARRLVATGIEAASELEWLTLGDLEGVRGLGPVGQWVILAGMKRLGLQLREEGSA